MEGQPPVPTSMPQMASQGPAPPVPASVPQPAAVTTSISTLPTPIAGGQLQVRVTTVAEGAPYRQLKVEDALAYLDKVKTQFGSKPAIYNKFLEIMKAFKAQSIDTPGVIKRVSDLFRGHPTLILGFNTFLPPGYKIEVVQGAAHAIDLNAAAAAGGASAAAAAGAAAPAAGRGAPPAVNTSLGGGQAAQGVMPRAPVRPQPAPARTGPSTAANTAQGPLEFDHAISYVTKIKRRFGNDPATYKSFLEILHTYQKQQRSIKDVLERVSVLFKDHADLLRDFTYFLPDAVQATAKDRIERSAEHARAVATDRPSGRGGRGGGAAGRGYDGRGGFEAGTGPAGYSRPGMAMHADRARGLANDDAREYDARMTDMTASAERKSAADRDRERLIDRARDRLTVGMGPGKSGRMQALARRRRGREEEMHLTLTPTERTFFERMKAALGTREAWVECLKLLDLFAAEVLSRAELLAMMQDLFGPGNEKLLTELKTILNNRGTLEMTPEDIWYSMPIGEIDLSNAARCTPSYRLLPEGYPALACSERSRMERSVLNDVWVSVPTGSEDYSFKIMRKNQYEDALFRCEDERYEIDMVIDNNASAIRVLEPLAEEIGVLKTVSKGIEWQFRLDRRSLGVLHLKAIARVYGEFGNEVLELLRKNPAGAIPIILARLKQKDEEWRRARLELNKTWKDIMEKNYYKSLDHRSFYFKQQDKKTLSSKSLVAEMKAKVEELNEAVKKFIAENAERLADAERERALTAAAAAQASGASANKAPAAASAAAPASSASAVAADLAGLPADIRTKLRAMAPAIHFLYRDTNMHRDAYNVLAYAIEKTAPSVDKGPVADLWRSFLLKFFQFPQEWLQVTTLPGAAILQVGELVDTPYGVGVIDNTRVGPAPVAGEPRVYVPTAHVHKPGSTAAVAEEAASAAAAAKGPVVYHVVFQWGVGVLSADAVKPVRKELLPVLSAEMGSMTGGAQPFAAAAVGRVKPVNVDPAACAPRAGPSAAALTATNEPLTVLEKIHDTEYLRGPAPPPESVAYVSSTAYVFFRLHQMLIDRLTTAKILCARHKAHMTSSSVAARKSDAAAAAAAAGSVGATVAASHGAKSGAVLAAAAGDLSAATAAGMAPGSSGDVETAADAMIIEDEAAASAAAAGALGTGKKQGAAAEEGNEAYDHYLTALYELIDGSMDASRYEDDCRELMGTGAYLMFTMDRLVALCAKQLILLTHENISVRLRTLWEYTQAQIKLARGTKAAHQVPASVSATLAAYRANVGSALMSRGSEDCYCVQYVVNPAEYAPVDILSAAGVDAQKDPTLAIAPGNAHRIASISLRYIGKPLYDAQAGTIRAYEYCSSLPAYLSRLIGAKRVIVGDESAEAVDEEALTDEIIKEAGAKATAAGYKPPVLPRTLRAAEHGASDAMDVDAPVPQPSGAPLAAHVEEAGKIRFQHGEEVFGRRANY